MPTDKPVSEWTDAEVYEECGRMLGSPIAMSEVFAKSGLDHRDLCSLVSRLVLDAMVERGAAYGLRTGRTTTKHSAMFNLPAKQGRAMGPCGAATNGSLDRAICEAAVQALRQEASGE